MIVSESEFTPGAEGWSAYNVHAAEVEFIGFVAAWVELQRPRHVVETGGGKGYTTAALANVCGRTDTRLTVVESEPHFHPALQEFTTDVWERLTSPLLAEADLTILDSQVDERMREIRLWAAYGKGTLIVHDVRPGNPPDSPHRRIADQIVQVGLSGVLLPNPRGGFLCRR